MRDELLKCLNSLVDALDTEVQLGRHVFEYDDVNLGKRYACSVCGTTSEFGPHPFQVKHSEYCRLDKLAKLIKTAIAYVPYHD